MLKTTLQSINKVLDSLYEITIQDIEDIKEDLEDIKKYQKKKC